MLQQYVAERVCTIQGHDNWPVLMRCVFEECQQSKKWMCLKCKDLHQDHLKHWLLIDEFTKFLQGDNEKYIIQNRKQLADHILQQLANQKNIILAQFQRIELQYQTWLAMLQEEEQHIQELYSKLITNSTLVLTERDIVNLMNKKTDQEIQDYQERQSCGISRMKSYNENIEMLVSKLEKVAENKHGAYSEWLDDKLQVYKYVGQYKFGVRVGNWAIINTAGETIGGGQYDDNGNKQGQWIDVELSNNYLKVVHLKYTGKYRGGNRIDQWDILDQLGNKIGGGVYNDVGCKEGQWIDVELCNDQPQACINEIDYCIFNKLVNIKEELGQINGRLKIKQGIKLVVVIMTLLATRMVLGQMLKQEQYLIQYLQYVGKYKGGVRIDQWDIKQQHEHYIGGGSYNNAGRKEGKWKDIELGCNQKSLIYIYHIGNYIDGIKVDQWETKTISGTKIGGGYYNNSGNKQGIWQDVELSNDPLKHNYLYHMGDYQNGIKIDRWIIADKVGKKMYMPFKFSGGGYYNNKGNKVGKWIDVELSNNYKGYYYLYYIGRYQDGIRINQWNIKDNEGNIMYLQLQLSGGGNYDSTGRKKGQWIEFELSNDPNSIEYLQHTGTYVEGYRVDEWNIKLNNGDIMYLGQQFSGGGCYNNFGSKVGQWIDIELSSKVNINQSKLSYLLFIGKYNEGIRIGQWNIQNQEGNEFGGGNYNNFGCKVGIWIIVEQVYVEKQSKYIYVQHISKYKQASKNDQLAIVNKVNPNIQNNAKQECSIF